jgi:hypothetical protein
MLAACGYQVPEDLAPVGTSETDDNLARQNLRSGDGYPVSKK